MESACVYETCPLVNMQSTPGTDLWTFVAGWQSLWRACVPPAACDPLNSQMPEWLARALADLVAGPARRSHRADRVSRWGRIERKTDFRLIKPEAGGENHLMRTDKQHRAAVPEVPSAWRASRDNGPTS